MTAPALPRQDDKQRCRICGHRYDVSSPQEHLLDLVTHENAHTLLDAMRPLMREHVRRLLNHGSST